MPNMSYCRFQNTVSDLRDCRDALYEHDADTLSEDEQKARRRLIELCVEIAVDYGEEIGKAVVELA